MAELRPPSDTELVGLFESMGFESPTMPVAGIDAFLPLINRMKDDGAVFLIKWDWERTSRCYTCLAISKQTGTIRGDFEELVAGTSAVLAEYARQVWGFSP